MMAFQEISILLLLLVVTGYAFIISLFTIGLISTLRGKKPGNDLFTTTVSVIIPVRNEEGNILRILEEIRGQDFPADLMEVIVADDHSDDATMVHANFFARQHPGFPLKLIMASHAGINSRGKKQAIERAVTIAQGEVLLLTDADTSRGPGWVSSMVSGFGSPGIQMVLGPVFFRNEKNLLQKIQSLEFLGLMGTTAGSARLGYPVMCNGANLAYRREAFLRTGGFIGNISYGSGDDQFMMSAIRKHYGKGSLVFNFDPPSFVYTEPEATFRGFVHQRIRWVSKSRGYRDPVVIIVGITVWLTHFMLLTGMAAGLVFPQLLSASVLLWIVKIVVEYPMVRIMSRFSARAKLNGYYFIAQVFQLFYVPLAGLLGLFLPYRWKGRIG
jgi:poly-beta-1,6-N-acetyl-D-glucosamine synthase